MAYPQVPSSWQNWLRQSSPQPQEPPEKTGGTFQHRRNPLVAITAVDTGTACAVGRTGYCSDRRNADLCSRRHKRTYRRRRLVDNAALAERARAVAAIDARAARAVRRTVLLWSSQWLACAVSAANARAAGREGVGTFRRYNKSRGAIAAEDAWTSGAV